MEVIDGELVISGQDFGFPRYQIQTSEIISLDVIGSTIRIRCDHSSTCIVGNYNPVYHIQNKEYLSEFTFISNPGFDRVEWFASSLEELFDLVNNQSKSHDNSKPVTLKEIIGAWVVIEAKDSEKIKNYEFGLQEKEDYLSLKRSIIGTLIDISESEPNEFDITFPAQFPSQEAIDTLDLSWLEVPEQLVSDNLSIVVFPKGRITERIFLIEMTKEEEDIYFEIDALPVRLRVKAND